MTTDLYKAACDIASKRFPIGEALAAAALTDKGNILTSVWVDASVDAACLCAETGTIAEAHKLNEKIIRILCVSRANDAETFTVLPACGICQERLAMFGMKVEIAIEGNQADAVVYKSLGELRPHYWQKT